MHTLSSNINSSFRSCCLRKEIFYILYQKKWYVISEISTFEKIFGDNFLIAINSYSILIR